VVDVRERAGARNHVDFNRRRLELGLAEAGVEYIHERGAGNPFRNDPHPQRLVRFEAAGVDPDVLERLVSLAIENPSVLLCTERDCAECHRSIVAKWIVERSSMRVVHLP
jgi:uncharacterized protein (DUF488 family)